MAQNTTDQAQVIPANETLFDPDVLVQRINDATARVLLPATVYISVLAFTGLVGNAMVFYYYCFKTKRVPTSVFITTLAVYDIFSCVICVPTEIVDTVRFYTFTDGVACRILRFLSYFSSIASGLTLVIIALERYKHIRRVSSKQMSVRSAKKYCVILALIGVMLSSPALAIFDAEQVPVPDVSGLNLTGYDCTFVAANSYQPYVLAFNLLLVIAFFAAASALSIIYGIIAWTIFKHKRRLAKSQNMLPSRTTSASDALYVKGTLTTKFDGELPTSTSCGESDESCVLQKYEDHTSTNKSNPKQHLGDKGLLRPRNKTSKVIGSKRRSRETFRVTILMISVTILFVLSFLPYLAVLTWHNVTGKQWSEFSDSELIGYTVGAWSFLYNSCLNPWIYGIFNSEFRQFYYNILCCRKK